MDGPTVESADSDLIAGVERRRAQGLSVAAACREAGISTSTYYRKRRTGSALAELAADRIALVQTPPDTVGLMVKGEGRSWPFTARAPFYWDQVFAEELSDSYVRREFGRGAPAASARGALTAIAMPGPMGAVGRTLLKVRGTLAHARLRDAANPLATSVFLAAVVMISILMVSVAADPAAWIDPGQSRVADLAAVAP